MVAGRCLMVRRRRSRCCYPMYVSVLSTGVRAPVDQSPSSVHRIRTVVIRTSHAQRTCAVDHGNRMCVQESVNQSTCQGTAEPDSPIRTRNFERTPCLYASGRASINHVYADRKTPYSLIGSATLQLPLRCNVERGSAEILCLESFQVSLLRGPCHTGVAACFFDPGIPVPSVMFGKTEQNSPSKCIS